MPLPPSPNALEVAFVNAKPPKVVAAGIPIVCPWYTNRQFNNPPVNAPLFDIYAITIPAVPPAVPFFLKIGDFTFRVTNTPDAFDPFDIQEVVGLQSIRLQNYGNAINNNPQTNDLMQVPIFTSYNLAGLTLIVQARRRGYLFGSVVAYTVSPSSPFATGTQIGVGSDGNPRTDYGIYFRGYVETRELYTESFAPLPKIIAQPLDLGLDFPTDDGGDNGFRAYWADLQGIARAYFAEDLPAFDDIRTRFCRNTLKQMRVTQGERVAGELSPETPYAEIKVLNATTSESKQAFYFDKTCFDNSVLELLATQANWLAKYFEGDGVKPLMQLPFGIVSDREDWKAWLYVYVDYDRLAPTDGISEYFIRTTRTLDDGSTGTQTAPLLLPPGYCGDLNPAGNILQAPIHSLNIATDLAVLNCVTLIQNRVTGVNLFPCCNSGDFDDGAPCTLFATPPLITGLYTTGAPPVPGAPDPYSEPVAMWVSASSPVDVEEFFGINCAFEFQAGKRYRRSAWVRADINVEGRFSMSPFASPGLVVLDEKFYQPQPSSGYAGDGYDEWVYIYVDFSVAINTILNIQSIRYTTIVEGSPVVYPLGFDKYVFADSFEIIDLDDKEEVVLNKPYPVINRAGVGCSLEQFIFQNQFGVFETFYARIVTNAKISRNPTEYDYYDTTRDNVGQRATIIADSVDTFTAYLLSSTATYREALKAALQSPSIYWLRTTETCVPCGEAVPVMEWTPIIFTQSEVVLVPTPKPELAELQIDFRLANINNPLSSTIND